VWVGLNGLPARAQSEAAPAPAPAPAPTPSADPGAPERVIVTARKREELLLDVPISMLSYSERQLRESGIIDLQTLKDSAGFSFQQSTLGSTQASGRAFGTIVFRGLQSNGQDPRDNSGSLFIDGIFISGGQSSVSTIGVQRVEVLKGPQNTYFGRNTFGGAVNFITRNPPTQFEAEVNSSFTAQGSFDNDLTVGGPLGTDALRGSVSFVSHKKAAQYKATDGGDLGAEKSTSFSGTLYATPAAGLWLRARAHYQQDDDSSAQIGYLSAKTLGGTCAGQTFTGVNNRGATVTWSPVPAYFCGSIPSMNQVGSAVINANTDLPAGARSAFVDNSLGDPFLSSAPQLDHTGLRRDTKRFSVQGGYELPYNATLSFSAGFNQANTAQIWDLDRSSSRNYFNAMAMLTQDTTYDLRLASDPAASLRGLFGASWFKSSYKKSQIDYNGYITPALNTGNYNNDSATVPALYGSLDYDITSMLTASVEARVQKDTSKTQPRAGGEYEQSYTNTLPRAILQFKPNRETNLYASWSKGVQPASFNSFFVSATPAQRAYVNSIYPDLGIFTPQPSATNLELGIKQSLMNDRMQYTLSAYQIDWKNQVTPATVLNPASCYATNTSLTPECPLATSGGFVQLPNHALIRGIEFSGLARVTPSWNLGLNVDYKDPKWKSFYDSGQAGFTGTTAPTALNSATHFDGNKLSRIPFLTASLNTTYTASLVNGWNWYTRADINYTGQSYESNMNLAKTDAYTRVNLRGGIQKTGVTLELYAKNLFDNNSWDYAYKLTDLTGTYPGNFTQGLVVYAPDRREIGARAQFKF
jgi:iron complex outermembrane receptor protein